MTHEQIILVKNTWKALRNLDPAVIGDLFYSKLFIDRPKLKKMFPAAMDEQHKKLVEMLAFIVSKLDKPQLITDDLKAMALRHEGYGVKREHYNWVGDALLWTLERGIGNEWNNQVEEAWIACYVMIAETMLAATEQVV